MIKIKKELLEQIQRYIDQDSEYIPKILKRLDPEIKDAIYLLLESGFSGIKMFVIFFRALENGLDNFNMFEEFDTIRYAEEIMECNPEVAETMTKCVVCGQNQLWVLVILYRIFESELEVRCMS